MSLWPYLKLLPTVPAEFGDVTPLVRLQSLSFFEGFSADVARELWIDCCGSGQFRCSPSGQQLLVVVNLFVTWPMVGNRNKLIVDQDCSQSHFYIARIKTLCAFILRALNFPFLQWDSHTVLGVTPFGPPMWQAEADTELTLSASPTTAVGPKALFHGTARVGIAEPTFVNISAKS